MPPYLSSVSKILWQMIHAISHRPCGPSFFEESFSDRPVFAIARAEYLAHHIDLIDDQPSIADHAHHLLCIRMRHLEEHARVGQSLMGSDHHIMAEEQRIRTKPLFGVND